MRLRSRIDDLAVRVGEIEQRRGIAGTEYLPMPWLDGLRPGPLKARVEELLTSWALAASHYYVSMLRHGDRLGVGPTPAMHEPGWPRSLLSEFLGRADALLGRGKVAEAGRILDEVEAESRAFFTHVGGMPAPPAEDERSDDFDEPIGSAWASTPVGDRAAGWADLLERRNWPKSRYCERRLIEAFEDFKHA